MVAEYRRGIREAELVETPNSDMSSNTHSLLETATDKDPWTVSTAFAKGIDEGTRR